MISRGVQHVKNGRAELRQSCVRYRHDESPESDGPEVTMSGKNVK